MNAIAAAIIAIVSISILLAATIYNIILDFITAHAQNITTTPQQTIQLQHLRRLD
jgi:hypothetical protein